MNTDQLEHVETIEYQGKRLAKLSTAPDGTITARTEDGRAVMLTNSDNGLREVGRTSSPAFTSPLMLNDEPGALAAIADDEADDAVHDRMAAMAGVQLANTDTRSTIDKLADLLGTEPTAGGLVDQVAERIGELRERLGEAPPPFDLSDDDLAALGELLGMKIDAQNWPDRVLLRLQQLETQLRLREQRGAVAASNSSTDTADDDTTRRMARMAGVKPD